MKVLPIASLLVLFSVVQSLAQSPVQDTIEHKPAQSVETLQADSIANLPDVMERSSAMASMNPAATQIPLPTVSRPTPAPTPNLPDVSAEYQRGEGLSLIFPDQQAKFRMRAYLQSRYEQHFRTENEALHSAFSIQRARLDVRLQLMGKYSLVVELDARGGASALATAFADAWYLKDHGLRIGKFNTPFSPEDMRSSRSLSTIARYNAINSVAKLPALDKQIGLMAMGRFLDNDLAYWFSITNGNGNGSQNPAENNNAKDLEFRLDYTPVNHLKLTASLNIAEELNQQLNLLDHTSQKFNTAQIAGKRFGVLSAVEYNDGPFLARAEWFHFQFDKQVNDDDQDINSFWGGFAETGYFLSGDKQDGIQLVARYERAQFEEYVAEFVGPTALHSFIVGGNLYFDGLFRIQVNAVYENVNSPIVIPDSRFEGHDDSFTILSLVQIKL